MGRRQKGLHFYKKRRVINYTLLKEIAGWVFSILVSVLLGAVFVFAFGLKTSVIGVSMEPGLYNGQQILINRFLYQLSEPKAGDVIVFLPNENQNSHYYVKRIVAVPGDRIKILDGKVYVNDEECLLQEYDKIADQGIAQNENENDYYLDNIGIVPHTYDSDDNGLWIISEYVLPARQRDFKECLGLTFDKFVKFIRSSCAWRENYTRAKEGAYGDYIYSLDEYSDMCENEVKYMCV